jgi:hypothetical protein
MAGRKRSHCGRTRKRPAKKSKKVAHTGKKKTPPVIKKIAKTDRIIGSIVTQGERGDVTKTIGE